MSEGIVCPFCKEDNFDLVGLKNHLINYCVPFNDTMTIEEESALRRIKTSLTGQKEMVFGGWHLCEKCQKPVVNGQACPCSQKQKFS